MKNAGRYLGAWGAIVLSVVLLSFLFTFLGTITCAVLIGMMMGAFKGARWFSVAVSLVFPGVVFGMVRGARVELATQQVVLLAVLCFVVFWATYFASAVLFFCEQKGKRSARPQAPTPELKTLANDTPVAATGFGPATELIGATVPSPETCLEQLQGKWVREAPSAGEPLWRRVIQITENKLDLKAMDASGRMTLLASGDLTLQRLRSSQALAIPQEASEPADFIIGL
jgi:hypothetical protein